jgi:hypothetical protein
MLKNCGAAFALLALIYLAAFAGYKLSSGPPCQPSDQTHSHCPNQKPTKNDPISRFIEWSTNDPVAFFTFILAIFTGALVVISSIQIRFLIKADRTASISANAARDAAEAARDSANAVTAQMRAYVSVVSAKIYGFDKDDEESRVLVRVANTGIRLLSM